MVKKLKYIIIACIVITCGFVGGFIVWESLKDTIPPTIIHIPVIDAEIYDNIVIRTIVTDNSGVREVVLNYTDINGTFHKVPMSLSKPHNYTATIHYQRDCGIVRYYIQASDNCSNIATTEIYAIQILLSGSRAPLIVYEKVIQMYSNKNETALYIYSLEDDLLLGDLIKLGTIISNSSGYTHITSSSEFFFYIPVLFSNDTSLETAVYVDPKTGNLSIDFFRGDLYINGTKVLSTEVYDNIPVTTLYVTPPVSYQPIESKENATKRLIMHIEAIKGNDTETPLIVLANPVEWEIDDVTSYYWVFYIPNLYPLTGSQQQFWLANCNTGLWEYMSEFSSLSVPDNGGYKKIAYAHMGADDFVRIVFCIPGL